MTSRLVTDLGNRRVPQKRSGYPTSSCRFQHSFHLTHRRKFPYRRKNVMMPTTGPIERAIARELTTRLANNNTVTSASLSDAKSSIVISENSAPNRSEHKRKVQVPTVAVRFHVTEWMINDAIQNGERHVPSRSLMTFPRYFTGSKKAQFGNLGPW